MVRAPEAQLTRSNPIPLADTIGILYGHLDLDALLSDLWNDLSDFLGPVEPLVTPTTYSTITFPSLSCDVQGIELEEDTSVTCPEHSTLSNVLSIEVPDPVFFPARISCEHVLFCNAKPTEFAEPSRYVEQQSIVGSDPEHRTLSHSFSYEGFDAVFDSDRASLDHFNVHQSDKPKYQYHLDSILDLYTNIETMQLNVPSTIPLSDPYSEADVLSSCAEPVFADYNFETGVDSCKCSLLSDVQVPEFAELSRFIQLPSDMDFGPEHYTLLYSLSCEDLKQATLRKH
jgi:hypothetical protein